MFQLCILSENRRTKTNIFVWDFIFKDALFDLKLAIPWGHEIIETHETLQGSFRPKYFHNSFLARQRHITTILSKIVSFYSKRFLLIPKRKIDVLLKRTVCTLYWVNIIRNQNCANSLGKALLFTSFIVTESWKWMIIEAIRNRKDDVCLRLMARPSF